jgi:hypothetical protein
VVGRLNVLGLVSRALVRLGHECPPLEALFADMTWDNRRVSAMYGQEFSRQQQLIA